MDYKATVENLIQMVVLQNQWIDFIKTGAIQGAEPYNFNNQISIYEGRGVRLAPFPHKELIEEISESDLLEKIQKDFMKGRDDNFIA